MAFRSRTRARRVTRKRDLLWISTVLQVSVDKVGSYTTLVSPSAWNFAGAVAFDRATLVAVRGWLGWSQTANATSATFPMMSWGFTVEDTGISGGPDPLSLTDLNSKDWLLLGGIALPSTAAGTVVPLQYREIVIKTKRKLTTQSEVGLAAKLSTDAASPAVNLVGVLRFLVDRS